MFLRTLSNRLYITNIHKSSLAVLPNLITQLNNKYATFDINQTSVSDKPVKKKTAPVPKITLILPENNVSITTIEEATKISKRRDLKLVKIIDLDTKTDRPVYKLMTGAEYHAEDLKRRAERKASRQDSYIKGEKLLTISHKISDHDLNSRIRNIEKWLLKPYEVRVVINGEASNMSAAVSFHFLRIKILKYN